MSKRTTTGKPLVKNKEKDLKKAVNSTDLDEIIKKINAVDYTCCFKSCKKSTKDFGIECQFCQGRFCTSHGLQEIHGCAEAVRREERRKMLHSDPKLSKEKHSTAQMKLAMKLKQMKAERKAGGK